MQKNKNKKLNLKGKSVLAPPKDGDLFSVTESDNSSSSNEATFEKNQHLVMELHDIMQRDELPDNPLPEVKTRKLLKKKRPRPEQEPSPGSLTSSASESSVAPQGVEKQEEFFDAHESYYDIAGHQDSATAAVTAAALNPPAANAPTVPPIANAPTGKPTANAPTANAPTVNPPSDKSPTVKPPKVTSKPGGPEARVPEPVLALDAKGTAQAPAISDASATPAQDAPTGQSPTAVKPIRSKTK